MNSSQTDYHPLLTTFRLYAGWLFAWLSIVYVLGSFQALRALPIKLSIVQEWLESPLILHVMVTTFLFLMLSTVHQALGKGMWRGFLLTTIGFCALIAFRMYA